MSQLKKEESSAVSAGVQLRSEMETTNVDPEFITVNVRLLSGPLPAISLPSQATVRDLKLHLQTLNSDFVFHLQKLLIHDGGEDDDGILLLNNRTLQSYRITSITYVVLILMASPQSSVSIDDLLKNVSLVDELLHNQDFQMSAISIQVTSICSDPFLLLKFCVENRSIQCIKINGQWNEKHLIFCEELESIRPGIDFRPVIFGIRDENLLLRIVDFCRLNQCSAITIDKCFAVHFEKIFSVLQLIPSLQKLEFGCNTILDNHELAGQALASALRSMSTLQILILVQNNLHFDQEMAYALQSLLSLHTLGLGCNRIDDACCRALAPALQLMSSLQYLDLRQNYIGEEGIVELAPALQSLASLHTLELGHNRIGDAGCRALAPALQSMSSLQCLDLHHNGIGDEGIVELAPALQSLSCLKEVDLQYNDFTKDRSELMTLITRPTDGEAQTEMGDLRPLIILT